MKISVTDARITEVQGHIEEYGKKLALMDLLEKALNSHKGKLIDKRFFDEHFSEKGEYRDYHSVYMRGKEWDWSSYNHRIYAIGVKSFVLELQTRETEEVKRVLQVEREKVIRWRKESEDKLKALQQVDEEAIVRDLLAVYEKHNKPENWITLLDIYEVKYPRETN